MIVKGGVYEYIHWTAFWVIFITWQFGEQTLLAPVLPFIPFFYELKALLFYWLCSDRFRGAGWLWLELVEPVYHPLSMKLAEAFNKHCPDSMKSYLGCPSTSAGPGGRGASSPSSSKGATDAGRATSANAFEQSRAVSSSVGKESLKS